MQNIKKKILFVDDEQSMVTITEMFFIHNKYQYLIAKSGEEAIEVLKKEKSNIGIIFLDLMMPGLTGNDVLRYIKKQNIDIPTIIQTGLTNPEDLEETVKLGVTEFLYKPYSKRDLFQYIYQYTKL